MKTAADVLIVDDESDFRLILSELLVDSGYSVDEAGNGVEALTYLGNHPHPKLILLDNMMPIMNGIEFCRAINSDSSLNEIPIIMISAADLNPSLIKKLNVRAFVRKPFKLDDFLNLMATYM